MSTGTAYCRIANTRCGLHAHVEQNLLSDMDSAKDSSRLTEPMKRVNGTLTPVSWESAIAEIGKELRSIRSKGGSEALGMYLGERAQVCPRTLVRSLAFGVGAGTPHIFSEANMSVGPQLWATEQVIGHAASLVSDLSRAHYVLLLSGEQRELGWGPHSPGTGHENWLHHSRKTKKTKVIVADPRRTELATAMDGYLAIRPGSESYLMLGMLTAVLQRGWTDEQFIRDYTVDFEHLKALVSDWNVEDFAQRCGIESAELSGAALKFARSPMSVVHPARQSFQNEAGGLGAWAWLALHAVTANILRPGGLFENQGIVDMFPVLTQLGADKAPRTSASDYALLLMQAPASLMPIEIEAGPVRALISVAGNPLGRLPDPDRTRSALESLDLLVCIGHHEDETAAHADWVLPSAYPWEQNALALGESSDSPVKEDGWTAPIQSPAPNARPAERIVGDLYGALRPGMRGSVWGLHWGAFAQFVARTDVEQWERRFLTDWASESLDEWMLIVEGTFDWSHAEGMSHASGGERRLYLGRGDRSLWRPTTDTERIELLSEPVRALLRSFQLGGVPELVLRTGQLKSPSVDFSQPAEASRQVDVHLHPDLGFETGDRVTLETKHGSCVATVVNDELLRNDVIDVPFFEGSASLSLLSQAVGSGLTGVLVTDGLEVRISTL